MSYKGKRSKATDIPKKVKETVWERDGWCCVLGGKGFGSCSDQGSPNAHALKSRAYGGLGNEKNIVTLCHKHHSMYDRNIVGSKEADVKKMKHYIRFYLESLYGEINDEDITY